MNPKKWHTVWREETTNLFVRTSSIDPPSEVVEVAQKLTELLQFAESKGVEIQFKVPGAGRFQTLDDSAVLFKYNPSGQSELSE